MCLTPFCSIKVPNSSDTNCGPLSDTSCSGTPYLAKQTSKNLNSLGRSRCRHVMNFRPFGMGIHHNEIWTSHKWTSKINMDSFRCRWWPDPGMQGYYWRCLFHFLTCTATLHLSWMSWSMCGHHTWLWAKSFILWMPGWLMCSSSSTFSRSLWGTTTRISLSRHPPPVIIHFLLPSKDGGWNYPHDQASHP